MKQLDVQVTNRLGLHARAAARFVHLANRFTARITVSKDGSRVNGKSILGLLTLAASRGTRLTLVAEGVEMIAVHARLAKNFHGGDPEWSTLGEMKAALKIPIIGNGGVFEPEDAEKMIAVSGVDGVMIGRGAIGNPWIFEQIRNGAGIPALDEKRHMMAEHLRRLVKLNEVKQMTSPRPHKYTPEEAACLQFRTHIPYYVKGMFDKKQLLMKLATLTNVDAILQEVDILVEKNRREESA